MSVIELKSVYKYYETENVLSDISLTIDDGERTVLLGPSGCGKTTILRLIAGFIAPEKGSIYIGRKIVSVDGRIIVPPEKRSIGMVFQDLALWPHLTVNGNLEFGLNARKMPRGERDRRIKKMLDLVGMSGYAKRKPAELSGGQQQRVALARALVLEPKVLLMDEPLSSLDIDLNLRLRKEVLKLHKQLGFTMVYVTHDLEEAFDIATRVISIKHGKIKEEKQVNLRQ